MPNLRKADKHWAKFMNKLLYIATFVFAGCHSNETNVQQKMIPAKPETEILVTWKNESHVYRHSEASITDKGFSFTIDLAQDSISDVTFEGEVGVNGVELKAYQSWSVTDTAYVQGRFKILKHEVVLNQNQFRIGDTCKGIVSATLLGHHGYSSEPGELMLRQNWDTINVKGNFAAIVK